MPRPHEKLPVFHPGDRLSAHDLNQITRAISRQVIGAGTVNITEAGNRVMIEGDDDQNRPPDSIINFLVIGERDDYLLCKQIRFTPTVQVFNPNPALTQGVVDGAIQMVAKPRLLQKSPWNLQTITTTLGDTLSFIWLGLDLRSVIVDGGTSFQQVVAPAYFIGDIILAKRGPTGYYTDVNGNPLLADEPGAVAVMWIDINMAARDWIQAVGTPTGGPVVSYVSNICPVFVAHVVGESPSGTINSINKIFTLASTPLVNSEAVYGINPSTLTSYRYPKSAYTLVTNTITFVTAPVTGTNLAVDYYKASTSSGTAGIPMIQHLTAEFTNMATVLGTTISKPGCITDPIDCCPTIPIGGSGPSCSLPVYLGCPPGTTYPIAMYAHITNVDAIGGTCLDDVCVPAVIDSDCGCINIRFFDPVSGCALIGSFCPNNVLCSVCSTDVAGVYWYFNGARTTYSGGTAYGNAFGADRGGTLVESFSCSPFSLQVVIGTASAFGKTRILIDTNPCGSSSASGSGSGGGGVGSGSTLLFSVSGPVSNGSNLSGNVFVPAGALLIYNMVQYGDTLSVIPTYNGANMNLIGTQVFPTGSAIFPGQVTTWALSLTVATLAPIVISMPAGTSQIMGVAKYVTGLATNTGDVVHPANGLASQPDSAFTPTLAVPNEYVNVILGMVNAGSRGVNNWQAPLTVFLNRADTFSGQTIFIADAEAFVTTTAPIDAKVFLVPTTAADSWTMLVTTFK